MSLDSLSRSLSPAPSPAALLAAALARNHLTTQQGFSKVDADGDGAISLDDLIKVAPPDGPQDTLTAALGCTPHRVSASFVHCSLSTTQQFQTPLCGSSFLASVDRAVSERGGGGGSAPRTAARSSGWNLPP